MITICKYPFNVSDRVDIKMPVGAVVLYVQVQEGQPFLWVKINPTIPIETRHFRIFTTGQEVDEWKMEGRYVGAFQQLNRTLVFHVFEEVLDNDA